MPEASFAPAAVPRRTRLLLVAAAFAALLSLRLNAGPLAQLLGVVVFLYLATTILAAALATSRRTGGVGALVKTFVGAEIAILCLFASSWLPLIGEDQGVLALLAGPLLAYLLVSLGALARTPANEGERLLRAVRPFVPERMARLVAAELGLLGMALFRWGRAPRDPLAPAFTSGAVLAPVLLAVAALSLVEMTIVHLLLARWNQTVAWVMTGAALLTFVYMVGLAKSLRYLPSRLGDHGLRVRLGHFHDFELGYGAIDEFARAAPTAAPGAATLNLAPMSSPNVLLRLRGEQSIEGPFGKPRRFRELALRMDDPDAFLAALRDRLPPRAAAGRDSTRRGEVQ